jgi:hypothetical protein
LLNKIAPHYSEFLDNSGIKDITPSRAAYAAYHGVTREPPAFGPHAVIDNMLKSHSEPYGYNEKVKAARSMLGGRDYARRLPAKDEQVMKDQAVLYQFLQGLKGLNFEGDTIDALYNKYGIEQGVAEKGKIPGLKETDYEGIENLFSEFDSLMK